jgi:hypothetical protein
MNIIFGAGKFSHTHLRVLNELNIKDVILAKSSAWTEEQKQNFVDMHKNISFLFDNAPDTKNSIVHIVTPSHTHLEMMHRCANANLVFVEKPSVLYNTKADFEIANTITNKVYQNDWLSQIQHHRQSKEKPKSIVFRYDIKNKDKIDHIAEIWSHVLNFISIWFEPDCKIELEHLELNKESTSLKATLDDCTELLIQTTSGLVDKSTWELCVDEETFNNTLLGGSLLLDTFNNIFNEDKPLTDWYRSSWMVHRFRLINCYDIFNNDFLNYYKENRNA